MTFSSENSIEESQVIILLELVLQCLTAENKEGLSLNGMLLPIKETFEREVVAYFFTGRFRTTSFFSSPDCI